MMDALSCANNKFPERKRKRMNIEYRILNIGAKRRKNENMDVCMAMIFFNYFRNEKNATCKKGCFGELSRRDDTLLLFQSAVPAGLCRACVPFTFRRLKPAVNNMPSLRDFIADKLVSTF
jgi:hypothetical protein